MKIALFTDAFLPTINGVVSSVINYSNGLVALGHQVMVVGPDHPERKQDSSLDPAVMMVRVPSVDGRIYPGIRLGIPTLGVYKQVRAFEPDVLHSFSPGAIGLMAVLMGRRLQKKVVFTHGTRFDDEQVLRAVRRFDVGFLRRLHKGVDVLQHHYLNLHDLVLVSTRHTAKSLDDSRVEKRVEVVKLPVDLGQLRASRRAGLEWKRELGIKRALIYVGRLSGEKRVEEIIDIFARLVHVEGLRLVIVGDGPDRFRLFEYAASLGLNSRIIWVDALKYSELIRRGAFYLGDVILLMSEWDTLGLSVVEGMACGLIPVGRKGTAVGEVIGKAGVVLSKKNLVRELDKIESLLRASEEKRGLMLSIKRRADSFEMIQCTEELVECYKSLLNVGKI